MLSQLWDKWKNVRENDPVKARLVRVLMIAGVAVLPFLSVWIYAGFAKALGMAFALVVSGIGLLVAGAVINYVFGWAAHYVFTGKLDDFDDWFDTTILDEWEHHQNRQTQAQQRPKKTGPTQVQVGGRNNVQQSFDSGPDWMKKP